MEDNWYNDHGNLIVLIGWMADQAEYDKGDLAYAVEKPWKFETVFHEAVRQVEDKSVRGPGNVNMMLNAQYGKRQAILKTDTVSKYPPELVGTNRSADCPACGKRFYAAGDADPLKRHLEYCELYQANDIET